jgi:hypothetical protein
VGKESRRMLQRPAVASLLTDSCFRLLSSGLFFFMCVTIFEMDIVSVVWHELGGGSLYFVGLI